MKAKIKGKLIKKGDTSPVNDRFQFRVFALETDEEYPQSIMFQVTQDNCSWLDEIDEGANVEVLFELKGKPWRDTFINTLLVHRISVLSK